MKRTPLKRTAFKRAKKEKREMSPEEREWKGPHRGPCAGCGKRGVLRWHHAVLQSIVARYGGNEYDARNAFPIGAPYVMGGRCDCHEEHHNRGIRDTRLELSKLSPANVAFAVELMGRERAEDYFARKYRTG